MDIFYFILFGGGIMAWAVGANDVANAMGTSVGSNSISLRQAVILAAVFEVLGALFAGQEVAGTIQKSLVDISYYQANPKVLMLGMISALYASAIWLIVASNFGWPVSTTHSIIGSIVGFGLITQGPSSILWGGISEIALGWIFTPVVSALLAWATFRCIQYIVFSKEDPLSFMVKVAPLSVVVLSLVFAKVLILGAHSVSGFHGYSLYSLPLSWIVIGILIISAVIYNITWAFLRYYIVLKHDTQTTMLESVEKVFSILVVMTASVMAFSHGANDVANAIGPMVAALHIYNTGMVFVDTALPFWVMLWGALGVALGVSMYGYKVMGRVGHGITILSPSRSFSAQFSTGIVVLCSSFLGFPVSTTQILVGGVMGVGFARGLAAVDLSVVRDIFLSWIVTIPAGGILSVILFKCFEAVL
ncbi:inorganic phosphate transporter [Gammaproteobacteria bacterium]|nr:inorganic phosphate transporter [Gammaproteobacteria bacterium]